MKKRERNYGLLMPVSCLPSGEGIGTFGKEAYEFIDYIADAGAGIWQVLPHNPTNYGDSPYQSCSSDALNYYFIDLATLVAEGLLASGEIDISELSDTCRRVNYGKQFEYKIPLLRKAFSRFNGGEQFDKFIAEGRFKDFAVFMAIKSHFGHKAWTEWEQPYRTYNQAVVEKFISANAEEVLFWQFTQFIFLKQYRKLKQYANSRGVRIMGDIPLYIAYDSVEVWKYGDKLFKMDSERRPTGLAGCPPDAFTEDGQLWGNPVYDWEKMAADGYRWWNDRISSCFEYFDILRIDHFRGFDRYWEVPFGDLTARNGKWEDGPKEALFADKSGLEIVAEDLGTIDKGVRRLMKHVGYPGMKILLFAFDGDSRNEHKPSNYTHNYVCYTGTHDNMPLRQYIDDLSDEGLSTYKSDLISESKKLKIKPDLTNSSSICLSVIKLAFASVVDTVIIPWSDLLAMGGEARMNLPSTVSEDNWSWRFVKDDFTNESKVLLKEIAVNSGRVK